jgi:flagellar biosynthetic protein FliQ
MTQDTVIELATQALIVTFKVSMPFLLAALIVGLIVSVFQAVTQIQEQTLTFVPKIVATGVVVAVAGPWMLAEMVNYTQHLYTSIPSMVGP